MKRIVLRMKIFSASCAIILVSAILLIYGCYMNMPYIQNAVIVVIVIDLTSGCILLFFFCRQYIIYRRALLIIDNEFLHIPMVLGSDDSKNISIYFSCFGILLLDKVIRFKAGKEKLVSVNLDNEILKIIYGKKSLRGNLEIYRFTMNGEELDEFQKQLYYETGVILTVKK